MAMNRLKTLLLGGRIHISTFNSSGEKEFERLF